MNLEWTATAGDTLDKITEYLLENADPETARNIERNIIERAGELRDFPAMGHQVPELERRDVRQVLSNSYRIIYRLDDVEDPSRIDVLGVVHTAQLLMNTAILSELGE